MEDQRAQPMLSRGLASGGAIGSSKAVCGAAHEVR
jgi:hypothetical protein